MFIFLVKPIQTTSVSICQIIISNLQSGSDSTVPGDFAAKPKSETKAALTKSRLSPSLVGWLRHLVPLGTVSHQWVRTPAYTSSVQRTADLVGIPGRVDLDRRRLIGRDYSLDQSQI